MKHGFFLLELLFFSLLVSTVVMIASYSAQQIQILENKNKVTNETITTLTNEIEKSIATRAVVLSQPYTTENIESLLLVKTTIEGTLIEFLISPGVE